MTDIIICAICQDEINVDKTILNSCKHQFCTKCITDWLNIDDTCPMCRSKIQSIPFYINRSNIDSHNTRNIFYCYLYIILFNLFTTSIIFIEILRLFVSNIITYIINKFKYGINIIYNIINYIILSII